MDYKLKHELSDEKCSFIIKSLMQNLSKESIKLRRVDPLNEICISALDQSNNFIAGVVGYIFYGSLMIDRKRNIVS